MADRSKLTAMISSEVQRTLVKSPPELWAEISDPESLARHLGEFGEIRITRVQPEQKVEWQGDRASGTVVIKPSGWGTKVKLTVTRDLALDSDDVAAPDDGDGPDPELAVVRPAPERTADTAAAPERERETQLESAPGLECVTDRESAPDLDSASEAGATPALEPAAPELPPAAEADLSTEPGAARTAPPASAIEPEPDRGATDRSERDSAPAGRRGFFARLFGRRRGIAPRPPAEPAPQAHRDDTPAPIAEEHDAVQPIAEEHDAVEPIADEPVTQEPLAETLSDDPPLVEEPTGDVPAADDVAADELTPDDLPADELTRDEAADQPIADQAAGFDPEAGEATEEVTAEQVEAVLTGVLDRLGAAHHRPFSRS